MQFHHVRQAPPPPPEFLMFYIRQEDGTRARGTQFNANKAMMDAWQTQEESGKRGVLCIVRENGEQIQRALDQDNHRLTEQGSQ